MFEILTIEEQATMMMNLFKYQMGEEIDLNTSGLKICWNAMKFLLEKDTQNYKNKVDTMNKNSESNSKLNNKKHNIEKLITDIGKPITDTEKILSNIELTDDNDNVNVNDNVNDNGNDKDNEETMGEPSVDWFLNELETRGNITTLKTKYPKSSSLSEAIGMYFQ